MRHFFLVLFCILANFAAGSALAENRVALVIGIDNYSGLGPGGLEIPKLKNAVSDANVVAKWLARASFSVTRRMDVRTKQEMEALLSAFAREASQADVALVYYAGHGIEVDGINYLIPAEAELVERAQVASGALSVNSVLRSLAGAKQLRIVVLDACREDPFGQSSADVSATVYDPPDPFKGMKSVWDRSGKTIVRRDARPDDLTQTGERAPSVSRGFAVVPDGFLNQLDPAGNTLIAYPVDPGKIAWDGNKGEPSPLAEAIASTLALAAGETISGAPLPAGLREKYKNMNFADFAAIVRDRVKQSTEDVVEKPTGRKVPPQTPWATRSIGVRASNLRVVPTSADAAALSSGSAVATPAGRQTGPGDVVLCTARTEMQLREDSAIASCLAALAQKPDDADVLGRLGAAHLLAGRDPAQAFIYLNRAALMGDSRALAWLGELYLKGQAALPADPQRAEALFRRSISVNGPINPAGQNNLGLLYEIGWAGGTTENPSPNLEKAASLYRQAATGCLENIDRSCFPPALLNFARMRAFGLGGEKADVASAVEMLDTAARHDYSTALALKGYLAERGLGGVTCDAEGAVRNYRIAAAQSDSYGQALLGQAYERGTGKTRIDIAAAASNYRQSAADGNPYGQAFLARLYARPDGVPGLIEPDTAEALRLLRLAIAQGNPVAKSVLARLMETGAPGVPKDPAKAMSLYREAAAAYEEFALTKAPDAAGGLVSSCPRP